MPDMRKRAVSSSSRSARRRRSARRPAASSQRALTARKPKRMCGAHAVFVGHPLEVVADLLLRREHRGPVRVRLERERVQVRRHVAGAARVGVLAPGAADRVGLLEDDEVLDARFLELDRCADAGEAVADDHDLVDGSGGRGGRMGGADGGSRHWAKYLLRRWFSWLRADLHGYTTVSYTGVAYHRKRWKRAPPPKAPASPARGAASRSWTSRRPSPESGDSCGFDRCWHAGRESPGPSFTPISMTSPRSCGQWSTREGARAVQQLMALIPHEADTDNPAAMLMTSLRAFLGAVSDDPVTWRLVLVPAEGTPEVLRERAIQIRAAVTQQLAVIVPTALASGSTEPSPDPELTALTLQAVAEEAARLLLERPDEYSIDRVMTHTEWMLGLLGFGAASPRCPSTQGRGRPA